LKSEKKEQKRAQLALVCVPEACSTGEARNWGARKKGVNQCNP